MPLLISGAPAVVSAMNRAFTNTSPANAIYVNQIAEAGATAASQAAWAVSFGSKFTGTSAALADLLLTNTGIKAAGGTALATAVAAIIDIVGVKNVGQVAMLLSNALSTLEADATYGTAAKAWNSEVTKAYTYSSNTANKTDQVGDVAADQGQAFTLTANADQVPSLVGSLGDIGTLGNDTYVATNATLSSADKIVDAGGAADKLKYSTQAGSTHSAFEMSGVETLEVTSDQAAATSFDLSGSVGLALLKALNSTGSIAFTQVTALADIEVNDVTNGANVTVTYQDSIASGAADDVDLTLASNSNVTPVGVIMVGRTGDTNGGVETINAIVSGSNTTVTQLDSDVSTLNVSGDKNLTITTALNATVDKVAAGSFTGALNINLTGNVVGRGALPPAAGVANTDVALSITTGTGNDVIDLLSGSGLGTTAEATDLATVTRAATIATGAGNDVVEAGLGADNIDLGAGDDTLVLTVGGLTVADLITGGDGTDQITFNTNDSINASEAERVTKVEKFNLLGSGSYIEVTNSLVNTADGGMFTINTNNSNGVSPNPGQLTTGGHTIDLTNLSFNSTGQFTLTGQGNVAAAATVVPQNSTQDTVIANDATVNAKATLTFGQDGVVVGTPANTYTGDTLRIMDGGDYRFDDFAKVTGLDVIELRGTNQVAQTYNLELVTGMIDNFDSTTGTVGDANDDLVIKVDRNVPQGSVVNINASQITATQRVTVYSNSNVTVNVTGDTNNRVTVRSSLEFTENSDNLVGTAGADLFTVDSLDQLDTADLANGGDAGAAVDTLQTNFAIQNVAATVLAQFNNPSIADIETLTFNTNNPVSFSTDGIASVVTVNFGSGNDTIGANAEGGTYNMGAGNNNFTETAGARVITVTAGAGTDSVTFASSASWLATDRLTLGAGTDTVTATLDGALDTTGYTLVSGVDVLAAIATGAVRTLTITDTMVDQADNGNRLVINANDADVGGDGLVVNASAVTATNAITVNVIDNTTAGAAGTPEFIGGAGADIFTVTSTAGGTEFRGNAGADTYNLSVPGTVEVIEFATANDGAQQGANTGFDVITNFTTGVDKIQLAATEGLETVIDIGDGIGGAANNVVNFRTDAAITFSNAAATSTGEALLLTSPSTGLVNADLTADGFANVLAKVNVLVNVIGGAATGGLLVVQGDTNTGIYFYGEQNGVAGVQAADIKLLGVVQGTLLATGDFQIA